MDSTPAPDIDPEHREQAARELARCHRLHLLEELRKAPDLLEAVTVEGITFAEHTRGQLDELDELFPGIAVEPGSINLMQAWYDTYILAERKITYADTSFKLMNVLFMERIRYVRDLTETARERFAEVVTDQMVRSRFAERGQTFRHILSTENGLGRLIEEHFARIGLAPLEVYRAILACMSEAVTTTRVQYVHDIADAARARSDRLLRNIIPDSLADRLRVDDTPPPPVHYASATIVFTDFVGFTLSASEMEPVELVRRLDEHFRAFDAIIERYELEKLKTIGDGYMFAGGIPEERPDHALACVRAALSIRDFVREHETTGSPWAIRIGVHTGPVVAGIIGRKKFSYDVWGDTVNIASRMESSGDVNEVNLSEDTYRIVRDEIECAELGTRPIKNRGEIKMFVARVEKS